MTPFLNGAVALVTGASQGLGAATAKVLARAGATVAITARSSDKLTALAEDIAAEGATAVALPADLSDFGSVGALVAQVREACGRIDFLMNVGGSADGIGSKLWETPVEDWATAMAANATGVFNLIHHVTPVMMAQHTGRMAFLTSPATLQPSAETGVYAASKAAVNQMVLTLAKELAETRIAANIFNPGPVNTPAYSKVSESLSWAASAQPLKIQQPETAALLMAWLCSPQAEGITGEFIQWDNPNTLAAMTEFTRHYNIAWQA